MAKKKTNKPDHPHVDNVKIQASEDWDLVNIMIGDDVHEDMSSEWHGYYDKGGNFKLYPNVAFFDAVAEVHIPNSFDTWTIQRIHAGGVGTSFEWDGDDVVIEEKDELLNDLAQQLAALGIKHDMPESSAVAVEWSS